MHYLYMLVTFGLLFSAAPTFAATNLSVPFASQAPRADWSQPWFDACEETSVAMVDLYYNSWQRSDSSLLVSVEDAEAHILKFFSRKHQLAGASLDEPIETLASVINNFYSWEAYAVQNPTIQMIQWEIDSRRPVIVPASGTKLQNPRFRNGGPPYHMYVISGYDANRRVFIVQEPGTQFGQNYEYSYDIVIESMHDFVQGNVTSGSKSVLFTRPNTTYLSGSLDVDNDGLTKAQELLAGTHLALADTDFDGFSDGYEVEKGYSPLLNENAIRPGHLIKTKDDPKVYLVQGNTLRHIATEFVFLSRGYRWSEIKVVSQTFANSFTIGDAIYQ